MIRAREIHTGACLNSALIQEHWARFCGLSVKISVLEACLHPKSLLTGVHLGVNTVCSVLERSSIALWK